MSSMTHLHGKNHLCAANLVFVNRDLQAISLRIRLNVSNAAYRCHHTIDVAGSRLVAGRTK